MCVKKTLAVVAALSLGFGTVPRAAGNGPFDEAVFQEIACQSSDHRGESCWLLTFSGTEIAGLQLDLDFPTNLEVSDIRYIGPVYSGTRVPILRPSANKNTLQNIGLKWNPPPGTDLVYDPETGTLSVVTTEILTTLEMVSKNKIFRGQAALNLGGQFDVHRSDKLFKLQPPGFGSLTFGPAVQPNLAATFLAQDLSISGSLLVGGALNNVEIREPVLSSIFEVELFDPRLNLGPRSPVDFTLFASDGTDSIGFTNSTELRGPAQISPIKPSYRCDFNGDLKCTSDDIDAISDAIKGDSLIVYQSVSGGLSVQSKVPLTTLQITSKASIFNGECRGLGGLFDICRPDKVFKLFPKGFSNLDFGDVTRPGLSAYSLNHDLVIDGSRLPDGKPNFVGPVVDLNNDGQFNAFDRKYYIEEILGTFDGDSNLDGEFNTGDLVEVFKAGEYEDTIARNSTWAEGDWTGDREFDSGDLVLAFAIGAFEKGPRAALGSVAVPEVSGSILFLSGLLWCFVSRRRFGSDWPRSTPR